MKIQAGYTADRRSFISNVIRIATKGRSSHVFIVFTLNDVEWKWFLEKYPHAMKERIGRDTDGMIRMYFESIWKRDPHTRRSGVRGPYSLEKLLQWVDEGKSTHLFDLQDIRDLRDYEMRDVLAECIRDVGALQYAPLQLFWNLKTLMRGVARPYKKRTKEFVTCVEFVARVLPGRYSKAYLDMGYITLEEYVPSSRRDNGLGLYELIDKANAIYRLQKGASE